MNDQNNQPNLNLILENQSLKAEFAMRSLDLGQVWQPIPDDPELENRQLLQLLDWVKKYEELGSREKMEEEGYHFPPIQFCIEPDSDWLRFEHWMQGKPVRGTMEDPIFTGNSSSSRRFFTKDPATMTEEEIEEELARFYTYVEAAQFSIELKEDLPHRLAYILLQDILSEEFDLLAKGFWHIDGCSGTCPECVQRPWCEFGCTTCWPDDEKAGYMVVPKEARRYVSPTPFSLQILKRCQEEEHRKGGDESG